jgi:hypothetical protein
VHDKKKDEERNVITTSDKMDDHHHHHQSHSEWSGLCCLQCIREKEVGVVEDLGTGIG